METQQYTIPEEGISQIRRKLITSMAIMMLLMTSIVPLMDYLRGHTDTSAYMFSLPMIAAISIFSVFNALKRQTQTLRSYTLTITENSIIREQVNTPTISIPFSDIKHIKSVRNGGILVQGINSTDQILVFRQLDHFDEFESFVNSLGVEIIQGKNKSYYTWLATIGVLISMLVLYTSTNKLLVGIFGTGITAVLIWSLYEIGRSKNVDKRLKITRWTFLLVLLSTMAITIMKLFFM